MSTTNIKLGNDFWKLTKEKQELPVMWREDQVSNHHVGVAGMSGAGKTHWIREFVTNMGPDVEIDIFDYHGDIEIENSETVIFSEATRYGFNPLVLNPDKHYGGVRRAVNDVIDAINSTSRKLGGNQEGVLRHLLTDAYAARGILADDPSTWSRREASEQELREIIAGKRWDELREIYPTLTDVVRLAKRKLRALWMGVDDHGNGKSALACLDEYCRLMGSINKRRTDIGKARGRGAGEDLEALEKRLEAAKGKAAEAHQVYLDSIETGIEFEDAIKYHSKDVLLSVITRLENLIATGIFNPNPPPFGAAKIHRYNLKPLAQSEDELKMFVRFRMRAIVREMMQRGESNGKLRRLVVLDESKKFNDEETNNPINVIVNEMRKFGLAILLAGQSPAHFSTDFIKNAGTLLLLNLATADWDEAARKLKIDVKDLKYLRPQKSGAVRIVEKGQVSNFRQISFEAC
ncbi:helicase HerA domain-containing protein [Pseudomonas sp. PS02302]|jgi:hypothetical protein|uniref:helicase HerA domain-containing protein n=1 Tax=Pseudomonas sp. PS02302 TaxID=2991428 RepID=UPI002499C906|nr:DUF87 domain-containing protein [Pseudomonas sp. PS02302]